MLGIERVQMLYKALELNRKSFCDKIGIGYQALTNMERRESDPSFKLLQNIKERFPEVNTDWLLLGKDDMFTSNEPLKTPEYIDKLLASVEESNKALQDNSKLLREKVLLLEKELERYDEEMAKSKGK